MIIDKLPNQGDFSGQPFEFQLSGVREMWGGRVGVFITTNQYEFTITNAEKVASNYIVGQSYAFVVTQPNGDVVNGLFEVNSVTASGSDWIVISTIVEPFTESDGTLFYPAKSNTAFATSIPVTITDTVTSEATTFNFPVTTAGDAQFYLGSFIDDAIRAKGLTIPNADTLNARAGRYNITFNNVVLNYVIAFGGRFNKSNRVGSSRCLKHPINLFKREPNGQFFYSSYIETGGGVTIADNIEPFSPLPEIEGLNVIDVCKKKDYQLKTLQIGSQTYDVTAPILRFLNPIGGVEEAWASGNNELTLNQGDTRFYQTILGETKIAGRNNSYQGMTLELVPQDYLSGLREMEAEINRLSAIQYSDYVELVLERQQFGSSFWDSIPVIVTPNSFVIASNNSNQLRQSISFEITFASPL